MKKFLKLVIIFYLIFLCFFTNNVLALNTINESNAVNGTNTVNGANTENEVNTANAVNIVSGVNVENETEIENEYHNGYIIRNYEIDMNVQENNVFDITETITAYFFIPKHGIYRKIPTKNEVVRSDGSNSKNNAKITDIYVNNDFEISEEYNYKNIIIGNANKEITGEQTYVIKYKYDIGEDPVKNGDEFYFNLIGDEWDTTIEKTNFKIKMPKDFDKTKIQFTSGRVGNTYNTGVEYYIEDNNIIGKFNKPIYSNEALTIMINLPEEYFINEDTDNIVYLIIPYIYIAFTLVSILVLYIFARNKKIKDDNEFSVPYNINPLEFAYAYKKRVEDKDVVSILISLANKGYLKIENSNKNGEKDYKKIVIKRLRDYSEDDELEKIFYTDLFKSNTRDEASYDDINYCFFVTINKILKKINTKEYFDKYFIRVPKTLAIFVLIIFMCGIIYPIISGADNVVKWFPTMFICILGLIILEIVFYKTKKRTEYGNEIYWEGKKLKNFIKKADKQQIEELVNNRIDYFYKILPYIFVLNLEKKLEKQFGTYEIDAPIWYSCENSTGKISFNSTIDISYHLTMTIMRSIEPLPFNWDSFLNSDRSDSYWGGGSDSGGDSGGGSGGGGGGSW